jgi:hypothetical protein
MNPIKYGYKYQEIFSIYSLLSSWSATYRFRKRGPQLVSLVNLQLWCLSWLKFPAQAERLVAQSSRQDLEGGMDGGSTMELPYSYNP